MSKTTKILLKRSSVAGKAPTAGKKILIEIAYSIE